MNRGADAQVRSATAQIAVHRRINLRVSRLRRFGEQRASRHHLSGLAIAALRYVKVLPRDLHRMRAIGRKAFNRGDGLVRYCRDRRKASARGLSIHMNRTRAAQAHAAAEFRAFQINLIPQVPQQRHFGITIELAVCAIYF